MGNVLPLPCMCKEARVVQATGAGAKKTKRIKRPAVANRNIVVREDQEGAYEQLMKKAAWLGCRGQELAGEENRVQVEVVMTRKDTAEFMARLEERAAAERKAATHRRSHLRARGRRRCGETMPVQDAWRPNLMTIPEN